MRRLLLLAVPVLIALVALIGGTDPVPLEGSIVAYRPDSVTVEECGRNPACLRQAYANIVYREGAQAGLSRLRSDMAGDPEVLRTCHQISHWMGAAGLLRAQGALGVAFVEGDETCGSGYWHGLMQARIGSLLADSSDALDASLDMLCADAPIRVSPWVAWQCVHGIGHGLLIAYDYELPDALTGCERLSRGWDVDVCANGVFMENVHPSLTGASRAWVSESDPEVPCNRVAERHRPACYQYAAGRVIKIGGSLAEASGVCLSFTPAWIDTCLDGLGRVVGANSNYRPSEVDTLCAGARERAWVCVSGAAVDSFQNDTSDLPRAGTICSLLAGDSLARCWRSLGSIVGTTATDGADPTAPCVVAPDERTRSECVVAARAAYDAY